MVVTFWAMPENAQVLGGKVVFTINGATHLSFTVPPQSAHGKNVLIEEEALADGIQAILP